MQLRTVITTGIILFWGVMMSIHVVREYDLLEESKPPPLADFETYRSRFLSEDQSILYELRTDGSGTIGDLRRRVDRKEGEIEVEQKLTIHLSKLSNSMSDDGVLKMEKRSFYSSLDHLTGFEIRLTLEGGSAIQQLLQTFLDKKSIRITGKRSGKKMSVHFENLGIKRLVDASNFIQVPDSFNPVGSILPPEPGKSRTVSIMDPLRNQLLELTIKTSPEPSSIIWQGKTIKTHKIEISESGNRKGLYGVARITPGGTILRQNVKHPFLPQSITIHRITPLSDRE